MLSGFKCGLSLALTVPYNYTTGFCICFQGNSRGSEDERSHLSRPLFKADEIKSTSRCLIYRRAPPV